MLLVRLVCLAHTVGRVQRHTVLLHQATQFVKLARDVQIVGTTDVSEADIHVAYTAEVKRKHRVGVRRMTYNDFLTALLKISAKACRHAKLHAAGPL